MFVLACAALIPLAWLIGEATEHAAEHTGPGIGGFLNASFGNAPELIIALLAVNSGLPEVVRGSLAGSVISNLLLVFGVAQIVGPDPRANRPALPAHATRALCRGDRGRAARDRPRVHGQSRTACRGGRVDPARGRTARPLSSRSRSGT